MNSDRIEQWARALTAPLIATAIVAAFQAWSPGFTDRLGVFGDFMEWTWTPTLTFAALAAFTLAFRSKRPAVGDWISDPRAGASVQSDGVLWVFLGWKVNGLDREPEMEPQCTKHRIRLHHKSIGKGEKLEPLGKAGAFRGSRSLYCVGDETGSGHEIRPMESANMATASMRASARLQALLADIPWATDRDRVDLIHTEESVESTIARVKSHMVWGQDNISEEDVTKIIDVGHINELLQLAVDNASQNVKRKQVGCYFARARRFDESLAVALSIDNNAEVRQIGEVVVDSMELVLPGDSPEWVFLRALCDKLARTPNHQQSLLKRMARRGILLREPWSSLREEVVA